MELPMRSNVLGKISVDVFSAIVASLGVAPIVTVIDTAVTEAAARNTALSTPLRACASKIFSQPHSVAVSRPFAAMFLLYSATYATANTCDTFSEIQDLEGNHPKNSSWIKLGAVSAVNMTLSVYKDTQFAKAFHVGPLKSFPMISYASFVLRDSITLFASFNLPPLLVPRLSSAWADEGNRLAFAQLLAPAASQLVVTPIHLLGLDQYYRSGKKPILERARAMTTGWVATSAMRMVRVVPGLALGNVANTKMRSGLLGLVDSH